MIMLLCMSEAHVPQVAALERRCFSDPWSENSIRMELSNPLAVWLVALKGEQVAGYIGAQTVMEETDILNVAVHPDYRRQGVGEALMTGLMTRLGGQGSRSFSLEVRPSNLPARALYAKLGFQEVGRRRNYYCSPREDALILRKEWKS